MRLVGIQCPTRNLIRNSQVATSTFVRLDTGNVRRTLHQLFNPIVLFDKVLIDSNSRLLYLQFSLFD